MYLVIIWICLFICVCIYLCIYLFICLSIYLFWPYVCMYIYTICVIVYLSTLIRVKRKTKPIWCRHQVMSGTTAQPQLCPRFPISGFQSPKSEHQIFAGCPTKKWPHHGTLSTSASLWRLQMGRTNLQCPKISARFSWSKWMNLALGGQAEVTDPAVTCLGRWRGSLWVPFFGVLPAIHWDVGEKFSLKDGHKNIHHPARGTPHDYGHITVQQLGNSHLGRVPRLRFTHEVGCQGSGIEATKTWRFMHRKMGI